LRVFFHNDSKQAWLDVTDQSRYGCGRTVLHWATYHGEYDSVEKLLKHGARIDIRDANGATPIEIARDEGHDEIVELIQKAEKARLLEEKITEILKLDPKTTDHNGQLRADFKQYISDNGIPYDLPIKDDNTALHSFARKGYPRFVRLLLSMKADVNVQNNEGNTPLHVAVSSGHTSVLKVIVKNNPRIDITNKAGETVRNIIEDHEDRHHYLKYLPKGPRNDTLSEDMIGLLNPVGPEEDSVSDEETFASPKNESAPDSKDNSDVSTAKKESEKKSEKSEKKNRKRNPKKRKHRILILIPKMKIRNFLILRRS